MKNATRTRPKRLGEKLRQIRDALGLSQGELLNRLGFGEVLFRGNVSQYELGTREPPLLVLLAYARAAGVVMDVLVDDSLDLPSRLYSGSGSKGGRKAAARRPVK